MTRNHRIPDDPNGAGPAQAGRFVPQDMDVIGEALGRMRTWHVPGPEPGVADRIEEAIRRAWIDTFGR